jgi:hypothetical protein
LATAIVARVDHKGGAHHPKEPTVVPVSNPPEPTTRPPITTTVETDHVTSIVAEEVEVNGGSEDDFDAEEDIEKVITKDTSSSTTKEASYQMKSGETLVSECIYDVDESERPDTRTETFSESYIGEDGKIYEKSVTKSYKYYVSIKTKRIKKFWSESYNLHSVRDVIVGFASRYGGPLTDDQLALFNKIAYTDGIKFESIYNYFQVKEENLDAVFRTAINVFKTSICESDIKNWLARIHDCNQDFILEVVPSDIAEVHRSDAWTVVSQVFACACSKDIPAMQILAWAATKSGSYKPGMYSEKNAQTVDDLITQFLNANLGLLFTCKDVPVARATGDALSKALKAAQAKAGAR